MNERKKKIVIYIALIMVTLAVYWQAHEYEYLNYDDPVYISENSYIQSGLSLEGIRWAFSTTYAEFWHPLTWLSLMADYQLYGLNAGGYHVTNLVLHILSTLLLFGLFVRMTKQIWPSAFVAAFFALHPLHVESVAWVSERKDVLSAFFWMLTLYLYVSYTEKPVIKRYLLVLFSFVLALMSKPMVVTLPVIMILLDYWPLNRFQSKNGSLVFWQIKEKLPFFVLSGIFAIMTIDIQLKMILANWPPPLDSRITNALGSFLLYLQKTFWPQNLTVCYSLLDQIPVWQILGSVSLILIISVSCIVKIKRLPYLLVGWFWYFVSILPVIGLIPAGNIVMADRYMYLPSIGISMIIAWGVPCLIRSRGNRKKILLPAMLVFFIMLSLITFKQCGYWNNSLTLFYHALQVNGRNYHAHINVASYLSKKNKLHEAIDYYNKAISINPEKADAYNNRGIAYDKMGKDQLAIKDFNKAISLQPDDPNIYNNRATFYLNHDDHISGCKDAKKACELGHCQALILLKDNNLCD